MSGQGGNRSTAHSALAKAVTDYLLLRKAWVFRVHGHLGQAPGIGDIIAVIGARMCMIELKTGQATQSAVQRRQQEALEAAGGIYLLVRDLDGLEEALVDAGLVRGRVLRPLRKREG